MKKMPIRKAGPIRLTGPACCHYCPFPGSRW